MKKYKVLVADDHPDTAQSLAAVLEFLGHEIRCAFEGDEALRVADEFKPDVAVLDINMPTTDGYEVARTLRAAGRENIFLIAMTGACSIETAEKAKHAGFDVHMTKPVEVEVLERVLDCLGLY